MNSTGLNLQKPIHDRYLTLSRLDPKPIVFYDEEYTMWFCAWDGKIIPAQLGLIIIYKEIYNSWPTNEMIAHATQQFNLSYYDYGYIFRKVIYKHQLMKYSYFDVLMWFEKFIRGITN